MEGGNSIFFPRHYQIQFWQIFRFSHLLNIYTYFFSDFKYIVETETSLFFVKYRTVRHFPPSDSFLKAILKNRITAYLGSKAREGLQKLFAFFFFIGIELSLVAERVIEHQLCKVKLVGVELEPFLEKSDWERSSLVYTLALYCMPLHICIWKCKYKYLFRNLKLFRSDRR